MHIGRWFAALGLLLASELPAQNWVSFESPQTQAAAISPDQARLFVVNTPDNRLTVFDLRDPHRPVLLGDVPVGLEPVAVAAPGNDEAWVVCHLSDAVVVVDVGRFEVVATLPCSDEPADIVCIDGKAFVSCATRREVRVFDSATRTEIGVIPVFADEPRAMVAGAGKVYVASMRSGNGTTILPADVAPAPSAPTNPALPAPPQVGLIVKHDDPAWSAQLPMSLPDWDVFEIDPVTLQRTRQFAAVGTTIFGLAIEPGGGALWATNTDAHNLVSFEPNLRGRFSDNRVTRIDLGASAQLAFHDLNPNINYNQLPNPSALATALAQPVGAVWAPDGSELYVAAFGTDRIGVLDAGGSVLSRIEIGTTPGVVVDSRNKRGPRALVHHGSQDLLYVVNRLTNSLSVVDTAIRTEVREVSLGHDPTPAALREGRGFLYDAKLSGNGTVSCATCHVDATHDGLAWDLGDPGGQMEMLPASIMANQISEAVHPMKGPMLSQTLQGLKGTEPFHWRGDRPDFASFNGTFATLMGGSTLSSTDMAAFTNFIESVHFPPNPNQYRDGRLPTEPRGESPEDGYRFFQIQTFASNQTQGALCIDCHPLWQSSTFKVMDSVALGEAQPFDVPGLKGIYKRLPERDANGSSTAGFGVVHDGSRTDVVDMHNRTLSHLYDGPDKIQAFLEHFDTGIPPSVGLQQTMDAANLGTPEVRGAWDLLESEARLGRIDLVLRGRIGGLPAGFLYDPQVLAYQSHLPGVAPASRGDIEQLIASGTGQLTFMGTVQGQGTRIALDRDDDGVLDGAEGLYPYGSATVGCDLQLRGNSSPDVGNSQFALVAHGADAGSFGVMLLGLAPGNASIASLPLLVDTVGATSVVAPADSHGVGFMENPIPMLPSLVGAELFAQAFYLASCGPGGLAASAGLQVVVQ
ncbi:MAG: hypothetical protein VYE77_09135 [Planctomycetota bacterium]|nr:hypothetical protein [Planctomycetota bacterium]